MKRFLALILFGLSCAGLWSVPARPGKILATQPDGTTIEVEISGDETFHYTATTDGYLVKRNSEGFFEYATITNGEIVTSGIRVYNQDMKANTNIEAFSIERQLEMLNSTWTQRAAAKRQAQQTNATENGLADEGIVILVNFQDVKFTVENPQAAFDSLLNQEGYSENGALGSARDYFYASSAGQYDPTFHIYGPYDLPNDMEYYGANNYTGDKHPEQMIVDAVKKLYADTTANINFADYDQNGDGLIDFVFVYYAGHNEAEGGPENSIWPHKSQINDNPAISEADRNIEYDGKKLGMYACTSELRGASGNEMCGVGTFCHEFGHVLGLMDLYSTNYNGHKTLGTWDIMDQGAYNNDGKTPPLYSAFERFVLGWLTPEVIKADTSYELENIGTSNMAFIIRSDGGTTLPNWNTTNKYYLLETRVNEIDNTWDEYLPGQGMIITQIAYSQWKWTMNTINDDEDNMGVDLIEADGRTDYMIDGKRGDAFPGLMNVTDFNAYDRFWLSGITFDEDAGTVSFKVKGTSVGVENVFENQGEIFIAGSTVYGLEAGMELRCIDMSGRTLWSDVALSDTYMFDMPQGLYCIIVSQDGMQRKVLKSVGK